ncbi:hypothetical protein CERSUDRAFT_129691 [Gelatoporia subvermispora B]|uniref:N-alpha-acetyltransferase 40 n=1 Tax=Ceriporiopsis subvermispora (strain B) TaxID=914234 RepID=M2RCN6_CERS8|nr:hypothetical protein CERSUDRAFT_129691 [Gelatoporia subvermispora B]
MPRQPILVQRANQASAAQLAASITGQEELKASQHVDVALLTASELPQELREAVFALWERNMRTLYVESSFGWDPTSKERELFHTTSRFIVVCPTDNASMISQSDVIAYTMFRFDREDGQNVVYCYELQVHEKAQRMGLGKYLMQQLASIGRTWHMKKIMLTCLKANSAAKRFYITSGFELDPTSPEYISSDEEIDEGQIDETVNVDYEILSVLL